MKLPRSTPLLLLLSTTSTSTSTALTPKRDYWNDISWSIPSTSTSASFSPVLASVPHLSFTSAASASGSAQCLNVAQHAVVVHSPDGTRVGCGTIGEDPWTTVQLVVDPGTGRSSQALVVPGYAIESGAGAALQGQIPLTSDRTRYNAVGKVVVVHAPNGTRVGCAEGIAEGVELSMQRYPGRGDGAAFPEGTVTLSSDGDCGANVPGSCLQIAMDLDMSAFCDVGENAAACGQIHVHTGTSCADASGVGGHLYRSDVAVIQEYPEYDSSSDGAFAVSGLAIVADEGTSYQSASISFEANLINDGGFEAGTTGGIHVHTGVATTFAGSACGLAENVGGHMYAMEYTNVSISADPPTDPWNSVKWAVDANGCFNPQIDRQPIPLVTYADNTIEDFDVRGHAVVVHNAVGERIACGVLNFDPWNQVQYYSDNSGNSVLVQHGSVYGFEISSNREYTGQFMNANGRVVVVHNQVGERVGCGCCVGDADDVLINPYPGSTSSTISGTVKVVASLMGHITLSADLSGLESEVYGGIHVHEGTSCADASMVGGHFYRKDGAQMSVYPGYTGLQHIYGFVDVATDIDTGNILFSTALVNGNDFTSLDKSTTGGVHIHQGTNCISASTVDGHFWDNTGMVRTTQAVSKGHRSTIALTIIFVFLAGNFYTCC